jgi:hypothetical protein
LRTESGAGMGMTKAVGLPGFDVQGTRSGYWKSYSR